MVEFERTVSGEGSWDIRGSAPMSDATHYSWWRSTIYELLSRAIYVEPLRTAPGVDRRCLPRRRGADCAPRRRYWACVNQSSRDPRDMESFDVLLGTRAPAEGRTHGP